MEEKSKKKFISISVISEIGRNIRVHLTLKETVEHQKPNSHDGDDTQDDETEDRKTFRLLGGFNLLCVKMCTKVGEEKKKNLISVWEI